MNILQSYAQSPQDVELFLSDSTGPFKFLKFSEVLAAFPNGSVPRQPFECNSVQWQLQTCIHPDSNQPVHLAVLAPTSATNTPNHKLSAGKASSLDSSGDLFGLQDDDASVDSRIKSANSKQRTKSSMSKGQQDRQLQLAFDGHADAYDQEVSALQRYSNGTHRGSNYSSHDNGYSSPRGAADGSSDPFGTPGSNDAAGFSRHSSQRLREEEERLQEQEVEQRKFTRNLVNACRKTESLERYKAIVSLIEVLKRRLATQLSAPGISSLDDISWRTEPGASLMQVRQIEISCSNEA